MDEKFLDKYIGEKIKEYRNKQKLTQLQLGKKIGVGHTTVSAYEKGAITLNMNSLFNIAEALGVKVDDLFPDRNTDGDYLEKTKGMHSKTLSPKDAFFLQKLIEKTEAMKEEEREKFLESIQFTVEYFDKMNKN